MKISSTEKGEMYYQGACSSIRPQWVNYEFSGITGDQITIAVIDSGCAEFMAHDIRIMEGKSFIKNQEGFIFELNDHYFDSLGHGTACIDIILQIAPGVKIIPLKIFGEKLETSIEILVESINYAINENVDIINLSLGTKLSEALYPLYYVCEKANRKNIVIVSANANLDVNSYPAIFENVISVSSFSADNKFDYIFNDDELCECLATGYHENALHLTGARGKYEGNSFAAPIISGFIAMLLQKFGRKDLMKIRSMLKSCSINNLQRAFTTK